MTLTQFDRESAARSRLVDLLRAGLIDADRAQAAPIQIHPDALRYARQHDLAGLALLAAKRLNLRVPSPHAEELAAAAGSIAARNLQIDARLQTAAAALSRAGVEAVALKGVVLQRLVYQRVDVRPMSDVDLLVMPANAERACRALESAGCQCAAPLVRKDFFPRFHYEIAYETCEPQPVKFDLHVRPFRPALYRRTVPDNAMFEGAQRIAVGDADLLIPSPQRMMLHLMVHAAVHGAERLLWLLDIRMAAQVLADRIDWNHIIELARHWRLTWPMRVALDRVEGHFGPFAAPEVADQLRRETPTWLDRLALWQAPRDAAHPISHLMVNTLSGGSLRDRLQYLAAVALPERDHMAGIYPHRHRGWLAVAHAWRLVRPLARVARR